MPFTEFYNITLEHIDFMEDYRTWQNYGNSNRSDSDYHTEDFTYFDICFIIIVNYLCIKYTKQS